MMQCGCEASSRPHNWIALRFVSVLAGASGRVDFARRNLQAARGREISAPKSG